MRPQLKNSDFNKHIQELCKEGVKQEMKPSHLSHREALGFLWTRTSRTNLEPTREQGQLRQGTAAAAGMASLLFRYFQANAVQKKIVPFITNIVVTNDKGMLETRQK